MGVMWVYQAMSFQYEELLYNHRYPSRIFIDCKIKFRNFENKNEQSIKPWFGELRDENAATLLLLDRESKYLLGE